MQTGFQGGTDPPSTPSPDIHSVLVPLTIWPAIVDVLRVASISHIKKLELVFTPHIPLLFNQVCKPVVGCSCSFVYSPDSFPRNARRLAHHRCLTCFEDRLLYNSRLGVMICDHCGFQTHHHEHYNYRLASRRLVLPRLSSSHFSKRVCFMKYWLLRLQGKEPCKITREELDLIQAELVRENRQSVEYDLVKIVLRRLNMQRYYHHVVYIMRELSGHPLVQLTRRQEEMILQLFHQLENVDLHRRVNMLSYPYLIRKFCELRGWMDMARVIPMLKSSPRLIQQDQLWHSVCKQKNWRFIPTSRF